MLISEDENLVKNLWECKRFSSTRLIKEFLERIEEDEHWIGSHSAKVANNRFDQTHCRKRLAAVPRTADNIVAVAITVSSSRTSVTRTQEMLEL